ncbi:hypothetical protein [Legionella maioricensis]|uniref:Uncharacterized protein n=1 Tax=Legionella maioricensis TaxID=2896528 RepID=A0A9X2D3E4_9GAMM|nr:hypothetical protein [Legionella maioricensis]MCL9685503.1 hypothetical protein [Legionella maioricensis]MCL9688789.1 hypothetical protein [Legionella maioricensis]
MPKTKHKQATHATKKVNKKEMKEQAKNPEVKKDPAEAGAVKYLTDLKNSMVEKLAKAEKVKGLYQKHRIIQEVNGEYHDKMGKLSSVYNIGRVGHIKAVDDLVDEVRALYEEKILSVRDNLERELNQKNTHPQEEQQKAVAKKLAEGMKQAVEDEKFGEFQGYVGTPPITRENVDKIAEQLEKINKRDALENERKKEIQMQQDEAFAAKEQATEIASALIEGVAKQQVEQQDSAFAAKEQATEIASAILEEAQKREAVIKRVERILDNLALKIEGIGQHHPEARAQAVNLHNTLMKGLTTLEVELKSGQKSRKEATDDFKELCSATIMSVMPALEKDLGWGEYLKNMLKSIANVFIAGAQKLGSNATFFNTSSKSGQAVTETGQELQADEDETPDQNPAANI